MRLMGDYNVNYLKKKGKIRNGIYHYFLWIKIFYPNDETRISTSAKTQIELLVVDNEKIETNFVSIYLKKDHFASLVVTDKYSM